MSAGTESVAVDVIASRIVILRGQRVILDVDLAALYDVPTKRLNEQVKRNAQRFPADFMFRLSAEETTELNRSQFATGSQKHRDPRFAPFAFTEHGAIMAATVLNSTRAVEVSIFVVRAFVQLRELLASHRDLAQKLEELEQKTETLAMRHDDFARNTRMQLRQVFEVIQELMEPPEPAKKRPIGFVATEEKPGKTKAAKNK